MSVILPGQTIGIIGGGQLGRMLALDARRLGYRIHVLDPVPGGPGAQAADLEMNASFEDIPAARKFADAVDVVTFEFENIPAETLAALSDRRPVHPRPEVLHVCRHRLREKDFLKAQGFPLADYRPVGTGRDLEQALQELGRPAILKTAEFGYDGKGQTRIEAGAEAHVLWRRLGWSQGVLEALVRFDKEISVICARSSTGAAMCFGPIENDHARHILDVSAVPAHVSARLARDAVDLARAIADKLDVVGLLTVEMFVVGESILVNELAPRPHNSGHYSIDACTVSQFEQHVRAVCGLPLGEVVQHRPAAMANLLGDLWQTGEPNWPAALALPDVKLHLYGKSDPRPGRKMGHLTALAVSAAEARTKVCAARMAMSSC